MESSNRKGISAAGNWIIDQIKIIDKYPHEDTLANITSQQKANGGSAYNILKDLAKLGALFPLKAIGLLGNDENGQYIKNECDTLGINSENLFFSANTATSFTDVMTVENTGRRTFFHQRGANAEFSAQHINLKSLGTKMFHLGYLLLLDEFDKLDASGRTQASYLFEKAKAEGFITSSDLVSENSERFKQVVSPSLPFIDILFLNEFEAEKLTGISIGREGFIDLSNAEEAAYEILNQGVNQWVVMHFVIGAIAVHKELGSVFQPSLNVPTEQIKGAAGAGDAFAAGVLYGIHEELPMQECLKIGVCSAASSLFDAGCSESILPVKQSLALQDKYAFRSFADKLIKVY